MPDTKYIKRDDFIDTIAGMISCGVWKSISSKNANVTNEELSNIIKDAVGYGINTYIAERLNYSEVCKDMDHLVSKNIHK